LKDDAQSFWLDKANVLELLGLFGEDIATSLSYFIKFIVEFTDVIPALQILQTSQVTALHRPVFFFNRATISSNGSVSQFG
jgi:hypothetical protein